MKYELILIKPRIGRYHWNKTSMTQNIKFLSIWRKHPTKEAFKNPKRNKDISIMANHV